MEIRYQIYEKLIVVAKVFYNVDGLSFHNEDRARERSAYRRPDLAVLRVSKAVHKEAEGIYLSKNQFVLPLLFYTHQPFNTDDGAGSRKLFSTRALRVIKHVSFAMDSLAAYVSSGFPYTSWDSTEAMSQGNFDQTIISERLDGIHGEVYGLYMKEHSRLTNSIAVMKKLSTMEIDFSNAYCLTGCCRMADVQNPRLAHAMGRLQSVRFLGLRNEKEQNNLMQDWVGLISHFMLSPIGYSPRNSALDVQELYKYYHVTYGSEGDPWAQYKINSEDASSDCDSMVNG